MDKRYPDDPWDIGKFRDKVNQKCRDAARKLKQKKGLGAGEDDALDEEKDN